MAVFDFNNALLNNSFFLHRTFSFSDDDLSYYIIKQAFLNNSSAMPFTALITFIRLYYYIYSHIVPPAGTHCTFIDDKELCDVSG